MRKQTTNQESERDDDDSNQGQEDDSYRNRRNKYGVNAIQCNWAVVMWCIMEVEKMYGSAEAGKQMKAINRKRERFGKYTAIPDWGTELFNAYFAK